MTGRSLATNVPENHPRPAQDYLATHRAVATCARELSTLMGEVAARAMALHTGGLAVKPVVRQTPGRCIVQLGSVALTIAWLRGSLDSVAEGELLMIVWRGAVAPRAELHPERASRAPTAATALWEDVLVADATSEATWCWRSRTVAGAPCSSKELAARSIARLHAVYDAHEFTE